jgi:hypothetical protein
MWPIEVIPDASQLFMRAHKSLLLDGEIRPNIFREQGAGMSVDWDKYSTPEQSRARSKVPADNGIVQLNTSLVRMIPGLKVTHDPVQEGVVDNQGKPLSANRAHSLVKGVGIDAQKRVALSRICSWAIRV